MDLEVKQQTMAEERSRVSRHEAKAEFYNGLGIDEWDNIQLYHYDETYLWEARYAGHEPTADTKLDALEALVAKLREDS